MRVALIKKHNLNAVSAPFGVKTDSMKPKLG